MHQTKIYNRKKLMYNFEQNTERIAKCKPTYNWNPLTNSMSQPVYENSTDDFANFKDSLNLALKNFQISSCKRSNNSESTLASKHKLLRDLGCTKYTNKIKGVEHKYNNLISHNEDREEHHFRILNKNVKTLLNKKKLKQDINMEQKQEQEKEGDFQYEIAMPDLKQIVTSSPQPSYDKTNMAKITINKLNEWLDSEVLSTKNIDMVEPKNQSLDEVKPQQNIIPEKFRNKKLPYLDKRIKTGYIKFFDEKNHFGFMTLTSEPYGEVFIFGKEFDKSNVDKNLISIACNNPDIIFKFRIMYYKGKHGESKKAVNLQL